MRFVRLNRYLFNRQILSVSAHTYLPSRVTLPVYKWSTCHFGATRHNFRSQFCECDWRVSTMFVDKYALVYKGRSLWFRQFVVSIEHPVKHPTVQRDPHHPIISEKQPCISYLGLIWKVLYPVSAFSLPRG